MSDDMNFKNFFLAIIIEIHVSTFEKLSSENMLVKNKNVLCYTANKYICFSYKYNDYRWFNIKRAVSLRNV